MTQRSLVLLVPLALAALAAALWLASGAGAPAAAPPAVAAGEAPAPAAPARGAAAPLAALPEAPAAEGPARASAPEDAGPEPLEGVSAGRFGWWRAPKGSLWVAGRVELPDGTPLDEVLYVTAEGSRFAEREDARRDHTVKVADDGTFRVAFSSRTVRKGRLTLRGRYLYLSEAEWVAVRDPGEVVLRPRLGGRVIAHVLPPRAAALEADVLAGVTVEARTAGGAMGIGSTAVEGWLWDRDEPGELELGGLEAGTEYTLTASSPRFADGTLEGVSVEAGASVHVDLALSLGVQLSGQVLDADGAPVDGARVAAMSAEAARGRTPFLRTDPEGEVATADGRFAMRGVSPGDLVLVVEAEGHLEGRLELGELDDGAERHGLVVRLDRGGVLAGIVRWPDGAPAPGATVRCAQADALGSFQMERVKGEVESGPDGAFEFAGLDPEGACNLTASAIHPDDRPDPSSKLSLLQARRLPLWMARQEDLTPGDRNLVLVLTSGDVLSGTVVDDAGQPVKAFRVSASPEGDGMLTASSMRPVREHFKDSRGRFHLAGVQAGEWEVRVSAAGYGDSERLEVSVPGAGELRFVVPRTGNVSGVVRDPAGQPAPRARVVVTHGGTKTSTVQSAADGRFEAEKIEPGWVQLVADSDVSASSEPLEFELGPAGRREGLVLALREGARLTVSVHPDAGPPGGRTVSLSGAEGHEGSTDAQGRAVFTGLEPGHYEVRLAAAEDLDASPAEGGWLLRFANQRRAEIELAAGQVATLVVGAPSPTAVRLTGKVTRRGEALSGMLVTATPLEDGRGRPEAAGRTDAEGVYAFLLERPGPWRLQVGSDWQRRVSFDEEVPAVAEHRRDLEIPEARITGVVHAPDGSRLSDLRVSLSAASPEGARPAEAGFFDQRFATTDAQGRFEFPELSPGEYELRAGGSDGWGLGLAERGSEYGRALVPVTIEDEDETVELEVALKPAGMLKGQVTEADGTPVLGAMVRVEDEQGRALSRFGNVRAGLDGRFRYEGLAAGSYRVSARHEGRASEPVTVRIYEGGESDAQLVLGGG